MVYHRGWDEQAFNRQWGDDDRRTIQQLIEMGFKITVTGGINKSLLPFFASLAVSVVICGRGIRETPDPRQSAHEFKAEMQRLWGTQSATLAPFPGGRVASATAAENAAKAIRWGVSEMGLLLTADGRECPGCDSPQRVCWGTRTEVVVPQGARADDLVSRMGQSFGRSGAFGKVNDSVIFLDPAQLQTGSANEVIELLRAAGNAARSAGAGVDVGAGLDVADKILRN
jgi:hypothetical protein